MVRESFDIRAACPDICSPIRTSTLAIAPATSNPSLSASSKARLICSRKVSDPMSSIGGIDWKVNLFLKFSNMMPEVYGAGGIATRTRTPGVMVISPLWEAAARLKTARTSEKDRMADAGMEKALLAVQEVVMRDFKIGKQKPVDLLVTERKCGWGHMLLVQDGLTAKDEAMLPIAFIGKSGESPEERLRDWIVKLEEETGGRLHYLLVDDPGLLISAGR